MTNTPAENSDQLAELIRALNHQTQPGKGEIQYPGDVYSLVGNLQIAVQRLPQLLDQINYLMATMIESGHVTSDTDTLDADHAKLRGGLINAKASAESLDEDLRKAHAGLSRLAWKD